MNKINFSIKTIIKLLITFSALGCVSVSLESPEVTPAENLSYSSPNSPFEKLDSEDGFLSWQNKQNGNSISVYNNCNGTNDLPLNQLQKETLSIINQPEITSSNKSLYNNRTSITSEFKGNLDGVPVKIKTIIFKKNNCLYNLYYVATVKNYASDLPTFSNFLKDFKAP